MMEEPYLKRYIDIPCHGPIHRLRMRQSPEMWYPKELGGVMPLVIEYRWLRDRYVAPEPLFTILGRYPS